MSGDTINAAVASTSSNSQFTNHLGIPKALFIEDVNAFMTNSGYADLDEALSDFQEKYQKYKMMERNLLSKKDRLKIQIPDIQKSLNIIEEMKHLEESGKDEKFETLFEIADHLYGRAQVDDLTKVGLWLGANVMLEYSLDEAKDLLEKNIAASEKSLVELDEDLDYLKDQVTTVEVSIARLHNTRVKLKQQTQQQQVTA